MMEFQQYFHELQTLCEDEEGKHQETNYFDLISKPQESALHSNILPLILSESDRQAMREYRRQAVHVENKLFEARRKKFSNILLRVMELTDKFQALEGVGNPVIEFNPVEDPSRISGFTNTSNQCVLSSAVEQKTTQQILSENLKTNPEKEYKLEETKKEKENAKLIENDNTLFSSNIFQKPKLHHSSSHQNQDSKIFSSNFSRNTPIDLRTTESVKSSRGSSFVDGSLESTTSTIKATLQSTSSEMINSRQDFQPTDSLASTALSMAFTDSSFASQHSVRDQASKSAQRQLNMDHANQTLDESYYQKVIPLTSTPTDIDGHHQWQKPATKKNGGRSSKATVSGRLYTKTDAEQDKALEKLDIMKRKLLMEKEKQMLVLKQQELARLRKGKENFQLGHHVEGRFEISSQGHFSSRPNSDMYSIPEQSFEGPSSLITQGDRNEVESASDKENNIYKEDDNNTYHDSDYNANHVEQRMPHRNESYDHKYDLQEKCSGEIYSRPISVQSKENIIGKDSVRSSLYVRQEFQKQLEKGIVLSMKLHSRRRATERTMQEEIKQNHKEFCEVNFPQGSLMLRQLFLISLGFYIMCTLFFHVFKMYQDIILFSFHPKVEMNTGSNGKDKFCILSAYGKGFLTRCLLHTEKIQTIVKTIKDTQDFLMDISKEGSISYQDKSLQERVQAQLFAAKTKLYDIFFKVPVGERMAYISHSRIAAKEKEDRMNIKKTERKQLTRKLSAATMKAMQRRLSESSLSYDIKKTSPSGQLGKRNMDTRALKPVQSTKSPQATIRSQPKRRSLASPLARRSIGKQATSTRPNTALGTRPTSNRKSIVHSSSEADRSIRQSRKSLDNRPPSSKRSKLTTELKNSKLPIKKLENGSSTYRLPNEELVNDKVKSLRPSTANVPSRQTYKGLGTESRPRTSSGVRRWTLSMAAQFNKQ